MPESNIITKTVTVIRVTKLASKASYWVGFKLGQGVTKPFKKKHWS
jgi:hypothetical protein